MRRDRLQNKVAGSAFTLPICAFIALLSWFLPLWLPGAIVADTLHLPFPFGVGENVDGKAVDGWVGLALVALIAYLLVEMNNRNQLLRIRSRMVSSVWLMGVASIATLHVLSNGLIATVFVVLAYFLLFRTYQERECIVSTFHYGLMLGVGSLFLPQLVVFLPLFLWHQMVFLRSMSLRAFFAALVGCVFPMVLWAGYWFVKDDLSPLYGWFDELTAIVPIQLANYLPLSIQQVASWGLVSFLSVIGLLHYLSTSYNDKIQVRMFLYILTIQFVVVDAFVALQPQHLNAWLPLLVATGAPLIAHFFALTKSWFTNALFVLSVLAFLALGYFTLCMPTLPL